MKAALPAPATTETDSVALKTLRAAQDNSLDLSLRREADAQAQSYASADYTEGLGAVRAKRKPSFTGS